jgi:hypothetical protein
MFADSSALREATLPPETKAISAATTATKRVSATAGA